MRPEVLESNFYAWRSTGNVKYYERAAAAMKSFVTYLKTPTVAYAPIDDVDSTDSDFIDDMESFWFAEVLGYLYLTFDDPSTISLDDCECHLYKHAFGDKSSIADVHYRRLQYRVSPLHRTAGEGVIRKRYPHHGQDAVQDGVRPASRSQLRAVDSFQGAQLGVSLVPNT